MLFSSIALDSIRLADRSHRAVAAAFTPHPQDQHDSQGDASEVVAKAKSAGIEMSPAYVHSIRYAAKRKKEPKRRPGRPKGSKNVNRGGAVASAVGGLKEAEQQLLEWILEHGTPAVEAMVSRMSERIRKLV